MKKKLKKSQASSSKKVYTSQCQILKEVRPSQAPMEVVEVGSSDSELLERNMTVSGKKMPNFAGETPSQKNK